MAIELSHEELNLLLFAIGGEQAQPAEEAAGGGAAPSCEDYCPVAEKIDQALGGHAASLERRVAHHLNEHLREGLIECGALELMAALSSHQSAPSVEDQAKIEQVNSRLGTWACSINLDDAEKQVLLGALGRLPRSAWLSMPRTLWRLRKKLRAR